MCSSRSNSFSALLRDLSSHLDVMLRYLASAALYCAYNNLSYVNLSAFDPTTYFMFLQMRMLMTGVIYQRLFGRRLTRTQWLSLLLVTVGCLVQKMELPYHQEKSVAHAPRPAPEYQEMQQQQNLSSTVLEQGHDVDTQQHQQEKHLAISPWLGVFLILVQVRSHSLNLTMYIYILRQSPVPLLRFRRSVQREAPQVQRGLPPHHGAEHIHVP